MPQPETEARPSPSPVRLVWLIVAAIVTIPYVGAWLAPPPDRAFVGTFHWINDTHNYASFVQQAEDGRVLFQNKLVLADHGGALVNLEWLSVGVLSRVLGRRPFLAYRIFALVALAGLLSAADRALRAGGLPETHRLPALLLVAFGGGFGGMLFELGSRPLFRSADLYLALFPFLEALGNPHWLAATWLLLESLMAFGRPAGAWTGVALGTVLGLVRPYDLAILGAAQVLAVATTSPWRQWWRHARVLLGLVPVVLYNFGVFYLLPTFRSFGTAGTVYESPPAADLLWALGPAAALAAAGRGLPAGGDRGRVLRHQMWAWVLVSMVMVLVRPVTFALQFGIGAGLPLLLLAALNVSRYRPAVLAAVALGFTTTAWVAMKFVLRSDPRWFVPTERIEAAVALRRVCRAGDRVLAPEDIGIYALARTACKPFASHPWEPAHAVRRQALVAFYTSSSAAERTRMLEAEHIDHLLLPGDPGDVPASWLGPDTSFRRKARVGSGLAQINVYSRRP